MIELLYAVNFFINQAEGVHEMNPHVSWGSPGSVSKKKAADEMWTEGGTKMDTKCVLGCLSKWS